jgi:hypothetical protein
MPVPRAFPAYGGMPASRCDPRHPDELTVSQACSHIIVDEHSGANVLRLPMLSHPHKDQSADEWTPLPDYGPAIVTILNRSGAPLEIRQPARRAQPSHYDAKGNHHVYQPPPAPMGAIGVLAGTHKFSSFVELSFSGSYGEEWFLVRASEDWQPAEVSNE